MLWFFNSVPYTSCFSERGFWQENKKIKIHFLIKTQKKMWVKKTNKKQTKNPILMQISFEIRKLLWNLCFFYENFFYWWRWHIYLDLNQLWTRSEKCAIGIEKNPQPSLSAIIWLPGEGSDYNWHFVCLQRVAMLTPVVCDLEYSMNVLSTVKSFFNLLSIMLHV